MKAAAIAWLILCSFFALGWITVGWLLFPFNIIFFVGSLILMIPAFFFLD
jgi:hypothetical protein